MKKNSITQNLYYDCRLITLKYSGESPVEEIKTDYPQLIEAWVAYNQHISNFSMTIQALNKMIAIKTFYEEGGMMHSFDPEENGNDITMKIKSLREQMCHLSPGKGAWYTAYFTVDNSGKFQTNFDYDNKPEFKYIPSDEKFIDDLKIFHGMNPTPAMVTGDRAFIIWYRTKSSTLS